MLVIVFFQSCSDIRNVRVWADLQLKSDNLLRDALKYQTLPMTNDILINFSTFSKF